MPEYGEVGGCARWEIGVRWGLSRYSLLKRRGKFARRRGDSLQRLAKDMGRLRSGLGRFREIVGSGVVDLLKGLGLSLCSAERFGKGKLSLLGI